MPLDRTFMTTPAPAAAMQMRNAGRKSAGEAGFGAGSRSATRWHLACSIDHSAGTATNEMEDTMRKGTKGKRTKSKGFTLIELLVVVAIIGILAAIAIPQFAQYRQRGFRSRVQSDVRNAATGMEALFVDDNTYANAAGDCANLPGFTVSDTVTIICAGADDSFTIDASSTGAPGYSCTWDSAGTPPMSCITP